MRELDWRGCYQDNLTGKIHPDAFAHPAKMAWGLTRRIFEHLFERGWLKKGDLVADPFGGIGVTGLMAASFGCPCILVELEQKFVDLANKSLELHYDAWDKMARPRPIILQGDSRNFSSIIREAVDSIITPPPYADLAKRERTKEPWALEHGKDEYGDRDPSAHIDGYGATKGQIGAMKEGKLDEVVAGIVTSAPYATISPEASSSGINIEKQWQTYRSQGGGMSLERFREQQARHSEGYGQSEGQLGSMPEGDHGALISGIVTSAPYAESLQPETEEQTRRKQERIAKAKTIHNGRALEKPSPGKAALGGGYGVSEGQLGAMKEGDFEEVKAVITSAPYAGSLSADRCGIDFTKAKKDYPGRVMHKQRVAAIKQRHDNMQYSPSLDNLGNLPEGDLDEVVAVITSPAYARDTEPHGDIHHREGSELPRRAYGQARGQVGRMSEGDHEAVVNGVVTSPPYGHGGPAQGTNGRSLEVIERTRQNIDGGTAFLEAHYGHSKGQIGNEQEDTYWQAVARVYSECFKALKPNGIMCVVVKDFVRNKKRMPLCSQTLELLQAIGFKPLERIRAWVVSEAEQKSLMPDVVPDYRKARKSFFRRLAERKGSPEINWEEVLICQKAD